jgi:hypothetical protein
MSFDSFHGLVPVLKFARAEADEGLEMRKKSAEKIFLGFDGGDVPANEVVKEGWDFFLPFAECIRCRRVEKLELRPEMRPSCRPGFQSGFYSTAMLEKSP